MIPPLPFVESHRQGLEFLRSNDFDNALRAFDQSVNLGESKVLSSRDEILETLRDLKFAFSEQNDGLDIAISEQEAADLFASLARMPERIRNALLLLPSSIASMSPSSLVEAQLSTLHTRHPRNLTDYLPPEILSLVGSFLGRDPLEAFILVGVSRRWREVFLADRHLWGCVSLVGRDTMEKLEWLLERGPPRIVRVRDEVEENVVKALLDAIRRNVASLNDLNIPLDRFRELEDVWTDPSMPLSALTRLYLADSLASGDNAPAPIPSISEPHPNVGHLTNLFLHYQSDTIIPLHPFLQHAPNLQMIDVDTASVTFASPLATPLNPTIIFLPNLTSITTNNSHLLGVDSTVFLLCHLERFTHNDTTNSNYRPFLFPPAPHPDNVSDLRDLLTDNGDGPLEDELEFISQLREMRSMDDLGIGSLEITDATIDALVWREDAGVCCARLRWLEIDGCWEVTGEALVRMVLSREIGWERGECAKLEKLDLTDGAVDWMEDEEYETLRSRVTLNHSRSSS